MLWLHEKSFIDFISCEVLEKFSNIICLSEENELDTRRKKCIEKQKNLWHCLLPAHELPH